MHLVIFTEFSARPYDVEMCVDASCDLSNCRITPSYQWCDIRAGVYAFRIAPGVGIYLF